jgi:uncharacterized damage-inducible protein DinB
MDQDKILRKHLVKLLRGGQAFQPLGELLRGLNAETAGKQAAGLPYTIWQLLEHMRFTLQDILDFSRDAAYQEPDWPDAYWVKETAPADQAALDASIQAILKGINDMIALVEDSEQDLYAPFAHGKGQTLLREAMLVAEHNAYHTGQVILMRRLLGDWK